MALSSACFTHAAKKAKSYGLLSDRSRGALRNFGVSVHSGRPLTLKQAAFAKDLLRQLADGGAISRDSRDERSSNSETILDAIDDD